MGKTCHIEGCFSGRNAEVKKRKQSGLRQLSLYPVPKSQELRKKWSESLAIELGPKHFICELHFRDEDIKRHDKITLTDGTVSAIPRYNYALHKDAVPTLTPHESQDEPINEEVLPTEFVECDLAVTIYGQKYMCKKSSAKTQREEVQLVARAKSNKQTANSPRKIVNDKNVPDEAEATTMHVGSNNNELTLNSLNNPAGNCNINMLVQWLKTTGLPMAWTWLMDPNNIRDLLLIRLNRKTCKPILHVTIHENMTITTCATDGGVTMNKYKKILDVSDFRSIIHVLSEKQLCEGTGITDESRARQCIIFLEPHEYSRNVRDLRCIHCRNLRRLLKNRLNSPKVDYKTKYIQVQHKFDLERRKHRRLQEKFERAAGRKKGRKEDKTGQEGRKED